MRAHLRTAASIAAGGWLVLVLLACCTSRQVMQAGLVPFAEPMPPPSSHGSSDIVASASGLTFLEPDEAPRNLGHYVPASQVHLAAMLRPIPGLMIRPMGMLAIPTGASPLQTGLLAGPTAPSFGLGVDIGYVFGDEREPFLVRPHVGAMFAGLATQISDPGGTPAYSDLAVMGVVEGGLDLGYWVTPWLLVMGSVDLRNGPTLPASAEASSCGQGPPFVAFGDVAVTPRISAEVEVQRGFGIFAGVAVPALGSPYASYPIVSVGLRASFGEGMRGMRRQRTPSGRESTPEEEAEAERR